MEERTGWQGQNESQIGGEEKKNGRLVGAAETSKEHAGGQEGGGSEWEHGEVRVDSMVNEGRFQEGNGGQAKRASLREVQGSMSA